MTSINFIKLKNTKIFLCKVSEEIHTKYLKNYIFTQIQSHNVTLDNTSKIFYTYVAALKSYQITLFNSKDKNIILEPFILESLYEKSNHKINDLYICSDFFALYSNSKLVYYSKINSR